MTDHKSLNACAMKLDKAKEDTTEIMDAVESLYEEMPTQEMRIKLLAVVRNLRQGHWAIASAVWNIGYFDDFLRRAESDEA